MDLHFVNDGTLSLVDITTMGDSCKRTDSSKIGEFDSGLKYAIAVLYRNGVKVTIKSGGVDYSFDTVVISPDHKAKEVLTVNGEPTAFSPQLGHNWELWMAYRELYSNCIDESGYVVWGDLEDVVCDTVITIHSCDNNIYMKGNWNRYFLSDENIVFKDDDVSMYDNISEDSHLRLYKNRILVYEDVDTKSQYVYDYAHASIDERRILNDKSSFENKVSALICEMDDVGVINCFIESQINKSFESKLDYYWSFSNEWVTVINENHKAEPVSENTVYSSIFVRLIEDSRFDIGYTRLSHSPSSWGFEKATVKISQPEEEVPEEESFSEYVKRICNPFVFDYEVVKSSIDGFKCLPDRSEKVIYVSDDFTAEDVWQMVKACFRIDGNDNPDYAYKMYVKLLNK